MAVVAKWFRLGVTERASLDKKLVAVAVLEAVSRRAVVSGKVVGSENVASSLHVCDGRRARVEVFPLRVSEHSILSSRRPSALSR